MSAGSCWVKPRAPLRLQLQVGMRRQPRQLSAQNHTASRTRERLIALLGRTGHQHLTLVEACPAKQRNAANPPQPAQGQAAIRRTAARAPRSRMPTGNPWNMVAVNAAPQAFAEATYSRLASSGPLASDTSLGAS